MRLGIACVLPPTPTGPADYVAGLLPALDERAEVICFVPDPAAVDPRLRKAFAVRPLGERTDADAVVYHIANNPEHFAITQAARSGPPGLLTIHDFSLHNVVHALTLHAGDVDAYRAAMEESHGEQGARLADLRAAGLRGDLELSLFDLLSPLLDRHHGAVVHSRYTAGLLRRRASDLDVWVIPHYAPPSARRSSVARVDAGRFVVGVFGRIAAPKRPVLTLEAFDRLRRRFDEALLLLAGRDDTEGELDAEISRLGLTDHVRVTGWLGPEDLESLVEAVDVVISLRWPPMGESSGTLARALGAGRAVVVQDVAAWAELPADVAVHVSSGAADEEARELGDALIALATDEPLRERLGESARAYARTELDAGRCADRLLEVAAALRSREDTAEAFRVRTLTAAPAERAGIPWQIPLARPGARLVAVAQPPGVAAQLRTGWGYEVVESEVAGALGDMPVGSVDVVAWRSDSRPSIERLAAINRILTGGGLLVLDGEQDDGVGRLLERAGFSLNVPEPPPAWAPPNSNAPTAAVVAAKATLPAR